MNLVSWVRMVKLQKNIFASILVNQSYLYKKNPNQNHYYSFKAVPSTLTLLIKQHMSSIE